MIKELITTTVVLVATFIQPNQITEEPVIEPIEIIETTLPAKCNQYIPEIMKYDWDYEIASKVMYAESGCNPTAVNKTDNHRKCFGSYGLFQISCTTSTTTDPIENIRLAYEEKYLKGGFKHWSVCLNGIVDCGI